MNQIVCDLNERCKIYEQIQVLVTKRIEILENIDEFERNKNPNRLKGSSIKLMEEERERKKLRNERIKVEKELIKMVKLYESKYEEENVFEVFGIKDLQ